jgi:hypothetical protein
LGTQTPYYHVKREARRGGGIGQDVRLPYSLAQHTHTPHAYTYINTHNSYLHTLEQHVKRIMGGLGTELGTSTPKTLVDTTHTHKHTHTHTYIHARTIRMSDKEESGAQTHTSYLHVERKAWGVRGVGHGVGHQTLLRTRAHTYTHETYTHETQFRKHRVRGHTHHTYTWHVKREG